MKSPVLVASILVVIGASAYGVYAYKSKVIQDREKSNEHNLWRRGLLPVLPGPYLTRETTRKLKFHVTDLGVASNASFDTEGHLNFDSFGKTVTTKVDKDADGMTIQKVVIPEPREVQLAETGKIVDRPKPKEQYTVSKIVNGTELLKGGKPFYRQNFNEDGSVFVQDDLMFYSPDMVTNRRINAKSLIDPSGKLERLPPEIGLYFEPAGSSQGLGTLCVVNRKDDQGFRSLYLYRQHQWIPIELGIKTYQQSFIFAKDRLYVSFPSNPSQMPFVVDKLGQAKRISVPPGVNKVDVKSANSNGDMVLSTEYPLPKSKNYDLYGTRRAMEIVVDGTVFEAKDFLAANGIIGDLDRETADQCGVNERGDIFVLFHQNDLPHLYLFRRRP